MYFLLIFTLISPMSQAKAKNFLLENVEQVWQNFLDCKKFKNQDKDFLRCTDRAISSEVSEPVKQKMREFVDQEIPFGHVHSCGEGDLIQPTHLLAGEESYCFELSGLKSETHGYAIFVSENKGPKLKIIKFKY